MADNQKIQVVFSPNKSNGAKVVKFISEAKETLDVAIYSITSEEIEDGFNMVKKKNINLRMLCDKQQAAIKNAKCSRLGGIIDKKSGLMHNKFIIRDNECVLTGSFNFTKNAIYTNRENFIIVCDKLAAQKYTEEFSKLWKYNTGGD